NRRGAGLKAAAGLRHIAADGDGPARCAHTAIGDRQVPRVDGDLAGGADLALQREVLGRQDDRAGAGRHRPAKRNDSVTVYRDSPTSATNLTRIRQSPPLSGGSAWPMKIAPGGSGTQTSHFVIEVTQTMATNRNRPSPVAPLVPIASYANATPCVSR